MDLSARKSIKMASVGCFLWSVDDLEVQTSRSDVEDIYIH